MKLAVVITHPIQYYAPVFRLLAARKKVMLKVFHTWERGAEQFDAGFGKAFSWDIPLLEGYDHTFVSNNGNTGKGFRDVRNPGLIKELTNWKPDAILVYGWNYLSHLKVMRHFKGKVPVIFRGDSTLLTETGGIKKILRRILLRRIYSYVDMVLYVGANNRDYFLKHGIKSNEVFFVPHSIDNKRFMQASEEDMKTRNGLMQSMGLDEATKRILFVGKFIPRKNAQLLIDAFAAAGMSNAHLIIVGDGELEGELKQRASHHGNIHFLPFQNQSAMPAVYRLAQVYCLPSWEETWGLAVNEAMASGLAIIASDKVGCAVDLVKNGDNGYIFKSEDLDDLTEKLRLVLSSDLEAMGKQSQRIIADWSIERQVEQIESALDKIVK
jgi:glycosyltransferase involved in cell wall biosynthesis